MRNTVLWKKFCLIGVLVGIIFLTLPAILPEETSKSTLAIFYIIILLVFIVPFIWDINLNSQRLLGKKKLIEQSFEAQQATIELLSLPLNDLSMKLVLNKAIRIILGVSWLKTLPQGAIFLNHSNDKTLKLVAEYNLAAEIIRQCAKVKYGKCLCGVAADTLETQYRTHLDHTHTIHFDGMKDHGHYNIPLIFNGTLYGVLCLYLSKGQLIDENEKEILQGFSVTIATLIDHKQALKANKLAKTVFEYNLTSLYITDEDNKILNVNPSFTEVTGYTEAEMIGQPPAFMQTIRSDEKLYCKVQESLGENDSWEGEIWQKRKNGDAYPLWISITAVRDNNQQITNYVASFADLTFRKEAEGRIKLSYYDSLTGLPNRSLFYDRLKQSILQAERDQTRLAILFIDLDRFKEVNDTFGHEAGDALLKNVAKRVLVCLRATDTLARLGGDEFVVILSEFKGEEKPVVQAIDLLVKKILYEFSQPFSYQGQVLQSSGSVGISIYPYHAIDSQTLIQQADTAMYEAKNTGRNKYCFFSSQMMERVTKRNNIERALRQALRMKELSLVYQPLVEVSSQRLIGAEALLRWDSEELGAVPPLEFIEIAEDIGVIGSIGEWVAEQVCLQYKKWQINDTIQLDYIAFNVSVHQLISSDFAQKMQKICAETGVSTSHVELEITEGGLEQYPDTIMGVLHELRKLGFKLAIDDFGTDYSSLSRLNAFNVHVLKIDRSFVCHMIANKDDAVIVRAMIDLASALGLIVVAEGVETQEQFELLKKYGCTRCQGYYLGRPVTANVFQNKDVTVLEEELVE